MVKPELLKETSGWYYKTLIATPGKGDRIEAEAKPMPFGEGAELDVGSIRLGFHVHVDPKDPDQLIFSLDNPVTYGPVVITCDGQEHILIPEEPLILKGERILVLTGKEQSRQMIFLSQKALDDPNFLP